MKINDFYAALNTLPKYYNFSVDTGTITGEVRRGDLKGSTVNPVTAVALRETGQLYGNTKRDTQKAGKALGLSTQAVNTIYNAAASVSNRGNTQVVRGKIRSALEI